MSFSVYLQAPQDYNNQSRDDLWLLTMTIYDFIVRRSVMNQEILKKNFEKHGFKTAFFSTAKEAAEYLAGQIKGCRVSIGGSITVKEMGLSERLKENNEVIWHWDIPGRETLMQARTAEIYLTSANGVSETGELVNIDGTGNRVSQTVYGPEKTYFIVGSNKIEPDLAKAMDRAKNVAAPKNAHRLGSATPCAAKGDRCYNCDSPERICRSTVIIERPSKGMEVEIVFVDEPLGY